MISAQCSECQSEEIQASAGKRREVISFSPRQKGFVHETGCFNNVHILNETIRAAKDKNGLVAIQLDIAKAIEAALERLGLTNWVRESIVNSYTSLSTTTAYPR